MVNKVVICFITTFSFLLSLPARACEVCPQYDFENLQNKSYFGFFYHREVFNGYNTLDHRHSFFPATARLAHGGVVPTEYYIQPAERDHQIINVGELRYNHNFNDEYNVTVMIPFLQNKDHYDVVYGPLGPASDSTSYSSGIGDIILTAERISFKESDRWKHIFKYGAGLTIPTGSFSLQDDAGNPSEPALELGRGAFNIMLRFTHAVTTSNNNWGVITFMNYSRSMAKQEGDQIGSPSPNFTALNYRFGDVFFSSITGFRNFKWNNLTISPRVGISVDWRQPNQLNGERLESTGGAVFFLAPGIDLSYSHVTLRFIHNTPLAQQLNDEQLGHAGRLTTGIIYSF